LWERWPFWSPKSR